MSKAAKFLVLITLPFVAVAAIVFALNPGTLYDIGRVVRRVTGAPRETVRRCLEDAQRFDLRLMDGRILETRVGIEEMEYTRDAYRRSYRSLCLVDERTRTIVRMLGNDFCDMDDDTLFELVETEMRLHRHSSFWKIYLFVETRVPGAIRPVVAMCAWLHTGAPPREEDILDHPPVTFDAVTLLPDGR